VLFSPAVNSDRQASVPVRGRGDDFVWSLVGTLVGGPIAWGALGWGADTLLGTSRIFLPIGVVLGFITSLVIVVWRFGRE
jgi:F0F1-type ATP synthase assembly protein I